MQVGKVIEQVRNIIQDTGDSPRYPDDMLVGYVNMAVQSIAVARPDLFARLEWVDCEPGNVAVTAPTGSIRVIEVNHTRTGNEGSYEYGPVLTEVDVKQLNTSDPHWRDTSRASACPTPTQYARNIRNPNIVFIVPGVPAGGARQVELEYALSPAPAEDKEGEIKLLPEAYFPIVVDGVVFLVEAMEDEAVNSRRAEVFLNKFNAALGITASSRILTDTDRAGLPTGSVANPNPGDRPPGG